MEFVLKLIFRTVHITSGSILIGTTFADALWTITNPNYALVQSISGMLLLISGLMNLHLIAPEKTFAAFKKKWTSLIHFKILLWLFLLPLPEQIFKKFDMVFPRKPFNQVIIVLVIIISVYAKQYRDWAVLQKNTKQTN